MQRLAGGTNYAIKPYIPRVWRYFLDFLTVERNAEQFRLQPMLTMSQERETAIVVTPTHSDSMPLVVERDEWRDDKIQVARSDRCTCHRLPYI